MAIITRSVSSQQVPSGPGVTVDETISGFTNGGILLSVIATWLGTELVDPSSVGTVNEAFKPGDVAFSIESDSVGLTALTGDVVIVPQSTTYDYRHPEYDSIRACDFTHGLRPGSPGQQGVVQVGSSVIIRTLADFTPYLGLGETAGLHRLQYELEFLLFE